MSLKAMLISCKIDAKEGRYVVMNNFPGEFLHADMKATVHMVLKGTIAELFVKLEPTIYRNMCGIRKRESQCFMYS